MKRRDFLMTGAAIAAAGLAGPMRPAAGASASPGAVPGAAAAGALPKIRIGDLEVSRLILGSNPFWGYSHKSAQLDEEMRRHHTDERIIQILDEAADCGLTALASPPDERWIKLWARYKGEGGRLETWISQCHGEPGQMPDEIDRSVKAGARAIFIQGAPGRGAVRPRPVRYAPVLDRAHQGGRPSGGRGGPLAGDPPRARKARVPAGFLLSVLL